jgi:hypothetical protein
MIILDLLSVALACVATVLAWWFVTVYRREPWRYTLAGQHLMRFTLGLAVIATWSVVGICLRLVFGLPDWLELALAVGRLSIFGWLSLMLWDRVRLLRMTVTTPKTRITETPKKEG